MINAIRIIWEMFRFHIIMKSKYLSGYGIMGYNSKYLYISKEHQKELMSYINKKARELAQKEQIEVFDVSFDELNKNETDKKHLAAGIFYYYRKSELRKEGEYLSRKYVDVARMYGYPVDKDRVLPRIELAKDNNDYIEGYEAITLLHELGHYLIYKVDGEQSEKEADAYVEKFFDQYLPPFFKWVFQIIIHSRGNKELEFTDLESFQYFQDYKNFMGLE